VPRQEAASTTPRGGGVQLRLPFFDALKDHPLASPGRQEQSSRPTPWSSPDSMRDRGRCNSRQAFKACLGPPAARVRCLFAGVDSEAAARGDGQLTRPVAVVGGTDRRDAAVAPSAPPVGMKFDRFHVGPDLAYSTRGCAQAAPRHATTRLLRTRSVIIDSDCAASGASSGVARG
jgi:hypothetical protein